jgi:two-component system KDP operon response regulator KdpE
METAPNLAHADVLIVSDPASEWRELEKILRGFGFGVATAATSEEALMRLRRSYYDVVLLDLNLSGKSGIAACSRIRSEFPVVWLMAMTVDEKINGSVAALEAGADDYIAWPFSKRELAARIRAAVRRVHTPVNHPKAPLMVGDFRLDLAKRVVEKEGREIRLTATEFNLLYQLMASAGQPILHSTLLDIVWGSHTAKERGYLRIYISELRKKLEPVPAEPRFLLTYMNVGYIFVNSAST